MLFHIFIQIIVKHIDFNFFPIKCSFNAEYCMFSFILLLTEWANSKYITVQSKCVVRTFHLADNHFWSNRFTFNSMNITIDILFVFFFQFIFGTRCCLQFPRNIRCEIQLIYMVSIPNNLLFFIQFGLNVSNELFIKSRLDARKPRNRYIYIQLLVCCICLWYAFRAIHFQCLLFMFSMNGESI